MEEKTPFVAQSFQMLDFGTSKSDSEVSKSNSWKITSFSKSTLLQREPFLTMFYAISTALHCLLLSKSLCLNLFEVVSSDFNGVDADMNSMLSNSQQRVCLSCNE